MATEHSLEGKVIINKVHGNILTETTSEKFTLDLVKLANVESEENLELLIGAMVNKTKLRFKGTKRAGNTNNICVTDIRNVRGK
jgi:hypothetical protein